MGRKYRIGRRRRNGLRETYDMLRQGTKLMNGLRIIGNALKRPIVILLRVHWLTGDCVSCHRSSFNLPSSTFFAHGPDRFEKTKPDKTGFTRIESALEFFMAQKTGTDGNETMSASTYIYIYTYIHTYIYMMVSDYVLKFNLIVLLLLML